MPGYDFRSLSPRDFECISRDLLQEELGIHLESFTSGPDSGIDFLHNSTNTVVQCKHYADSSASTLLAHMRKERKGKMASLAPHTRYILTTSLGLSPTLKGKLAEILHPYCKSTADIYGRDDLNNLLSRHPSVELNHHKLWLTSTPVIQRMLNAGIILDSSSHLDDIRGRLSRYVPNDSLYRAMKLLEEKHLCIVSGIPGIGKTTLAEILLADLADRQEFSVIRITKLDDIRSVKNKTERQAFYFDDFLGQTNLTDLERNEDRDLVNLMDEVSRNDRWRLILTTREYILNTARRRYEAFNRLPKGFATCIVNLGDYTPSIRAEILYNHIYFSSLPRSHKLELLDSGAYRDIVAHRNYVPRLIQLMTESAVVRDLGPKEYVRHFIENLNNPVRIWEYAFENQISEASRHLLLVLAVLPDRVFEQDAKECFWSFCEYRRLRYGLVTGPRDWANALKELDGSFLSTTKMGNYIAIGFHNPSVKDFMNGHLDQSQDDASDLLAATTFFEQCVGLWNRSSHRAKDSVGRSWRRELVERVASFVPGRSAREIVEDVEGACYMRTESDEAQARFLAKITMAVGSKPDETLEPALGRLSKQWRESRGDGDDVLRLLADLPRSLLDGRMQVVLAARDFILSNCDTIEDLYVSAQFCEAFPRFVSGHMEEELAEAFGVVMPDWRSYHPESPDMLADVAEKMAFVGERLNVNVEDVIEEINERIGELDEMADGALEDRKMRRWEQDKVGPPAADVDRMFSRLRDHLVDL